VCRGIWVPEARQAHFCPAGFKLSSRITRRDA